MSNRSVDLHASRRDRVTMRRLGGVVFAVVAALAGTACGGGGKGSDSTGATTTAPPATVTSTAPTTTDPAKVAKAAAAVLQPGDFPAGWTAQPPDDPGLGIDAVWQDLVKCLQLPQAPSVGAATSPTFLRPLATQARSTVEYSATPPAGEVPLALAGPAFPRCATDAFTADVNRSKPEGSTPGPVQVAPRDYQQYGQKTLAWRINASVNLQDLQVPLFQDYIVVFNGTTVIRFFFLNTGSAFPQDLEKTLVEKVVGRA